MKPIVIIDYGVANLRSVQKAFEKVGHAACITADPNMAADAEKLVLPGVGAFGDGIAFLRQTGLAEVVCDHVRAGRPFLGICLGMEMLFTRSEEDGEHLGLNLFPGDVVRIASVPGIKVPHMGWNHLRLKQNAPHLAGLPENPAVYFVHSYHVVPREPHMIAAETDYPTPFCSAIWHENVFGTQFHPEKSQRVGLHILHKFATLE